MDIAFAEVDNMVRADTLKVGDGFMDDEAVFLIIGRNPRHFDLTIRKNGLRPHIVVVNLTFDGLGHVRKDKMVTPVELKLNVGRKNV